MTAERDDPREGMDDAYWIDMSSGRWTRPKLTAPDVASLLETVEKVVHDAYARFNGRPVRSYIPLFVERDAKVQLAGLTS